MITVRRICESCGRTFKQVFDPMFPLHAQCSDCRPVRTPRTGTKQSRIKPHAH